MHFDLRTCFIWTARLEGTSLLVLMGIAMPLKYGAGWTHATQWPGWLHGLLFLAYVVLLSVLSRRDRWTLVDTSLGFIASLVPMGTFLFERRMREPLQMTDT